jgi:hypothetical protein
MTYRTQAIQASMRMNDDTRLTQQAEQFQRLFGIHSRWQPQLRGKLTGNPWRSEKAE